MVVVVIPASLMEPYAIMSVIIITVQILAMNTILIAPPPHHQVLNASASKILPAYAKMLKDWDLIALVMPTAVVITTGKK